MPETVLVNLLSEQRLPNFIVAMQTQPDRVLALCTPQFQGDPARFETLTGIPHTALPGSPYELGANLDRISKAIEDFPSDARVLFNFTGGTKIMAVAAVFAALAVRRNRNVELCYLETTASRMDRYGFDSAGRFTALPSEPVHVHVPFEAYAGLLDEKIKPGYWTASSPEIEARHAAAAALLRPECNRYFERQKDGHAGNGPKTQARIDFSSDKRQGFVEWSPAGGTLKTPNGEVYSVPGGDAGHFFSGRWLEEYCFVRLLRSSRFRQVLCDVTLELRPETVERLPRPELRDKNQLDVVVCDGVRAALIECKAGRISKEHLHTLDTLRRHLLGSLGIAVLVSRFPLPPREREQAETLRIRTVHGENIADLPKSLSRWFAGK